MFTRLIGRYSCHFYLKNGKQEEDRANTREQNTELYTEGRRQGKNERSIHQNPNIRRWNLTPCLPSEQFKLEPMNEQIMRSISALWQAIDWLTIEFAHFALWLSLLSDGNLELRFLGLFGQRVGAHRGSESNFVDCLLLYQLWRNRSRFCGKMEFHYPRVSPGAHTLTKIMLTDSGYEIGLPADGVVHAWVGSLRKHDVDGSENIIWKCNFAFLQ